MNNLKEEGNVLLVEIAMNVDNLYTFVQGAINGDNLNRIIGVINHCHTYVAQITGVAQHVQDKMADGEVDNIITAAIHDIDHFIENTILILQGFVNGENNVETLQRAIARLTTINNFIKRHANFEGKLTSEAQAELDQLRSQALGAINQFRNTLLPPIPRYVNLKTNFDELTWALDGINYVADTTNHDNL